MSGGTRRAIGLGLTGSLAVAASIASYFEGRHLIAYLDPVGIPTICEGVTKGVKLGDVKTDAECDAMFTLELMGHKQDVDRLVKVPMTPNEEAAWISFVYNVGAPAFAKSTALRKLNAGDHVGACNEMTRWVYAGGKKLRGLERRRAAERELCLMR